jgi:peroxiredoxin Q/BCP
MPRGPREGDLAPDVELEGTGGPFRLTDHRGSRVVLLFYPGDDTPVCTKQFCSYRDREADLSSLDAVVVGISHQDVASHERFIEHHGLTVPLLADTDKAVAKAYGVSMTILGTRRAAFLIDEEGVVRWRRVHTLGLAYVSVDDLAEVLATLPRTRPQGELLEADPRR